TRAGPPATDTCRRWRPGLCPATASASMKFKHKLAHRLALLNGRFLVGAATGLALLWAASCEKPVTLTEPNQSVAQFVVSPKVVTLQQNQVQDFTAVGFMATGDTAAGDLVEQQPGRCHCRPERARDRSDCWLRDDHRDE